MGNADICALCQDLIGSAAAQGSLRCLRLGPAAGASQGAIDDEAFDGILRCTGKLAQLQLLDVKGLTTDQEETLLQVWI